MKTPAPVMQQVYSLTDAMYFGAVDAQRPRRRVAAMREQATALGEGDGAGGGGAGGVREEGGRARRAARGRGRRRRGAMRRRTAGRLAAPAARRTRLGRRASLAGQMNSMQAADVAPTATTLAAVTAALGAADPVMARWESLKTVDLPALNATLKAAGLPPIGGRIRPLDERSRFGAVCSSPKGPLRPSTRSGRP